MTQVALGTAATQESGGANSAEQRLPAAGSQSVSAAVQFRRLLEGSSIEAGGRDATRGAAGKTDSSNVFVSDALARMLLRAQPSQKGDLQQANVIQPQTQMTPAGGFPAVSAQTLTRAQASSEEGVSQDVRAEKTRASSAASRDDGRADSQASVGVTVAVQLPAPMATAQTLANAGVTTASATPAPTSMGELAQLLAEQCQGLYVGVGVGAGDNAGRVMLRLGGAMSGVSAEIVTTAAGLSVRMHVMDHDKWEAIAARKDELEQLLSESTHLPVRIEPVFAGGRS